ncbi:non-ribosomal peptide synthetase [Saccharothrix deserti]|uniref:non-ribosomal peptide synthetase n=1 Tax=Saccharothrix deserti TaxID=2593674 RepID=UPI00131BA305|nr:condensation domain-containing protein [Saccharothrix deserti]
MLSPQQELVWLHHRLAPGSSAYNFLAVTDFVGPLDVEALRRAISLVVRHHPAMRLAVVDPESDQPLQRLVDLPDVPIASVDLAGAADAEAEFGRLVATFTDESFDLTRAPLAKWCVVRFSADHHRLLHAEDHLIHDGRSFAVFLADMFTAYRELSEGREPVLAPAVTYVEYLDHCKSPAFRAGVEDRLEWWRTSLAGADLGTFGFRGLGRRVGTRRGFGGGQVRRELPADLCADIDALARSVSSTPFSLLFGLFSELVRRHDGAAEVTVGTAAANRPSRFERTVGMLVNSLPVRQRFEPGWTARQLASATTDRLFDALDHGDAPMQDIVRVCGRSSGTLDNPLFRTMFSMHDALLPDIELPGLEVSFVEGINLSTSRTADIDVVILPGTRALGAEGGTITCVWDYSTEFFDKATVSFLADRFQRLLEAAVASPDSPVAQLGLIGPHDPSAVLTGADRQVPSRAEVLDHVRAHRGPALVNGTQELSYPELVGRADTLAARLARAGVEEGEIVAAVLPRGVAAVELLLACLVGGYVFAPLPVGWTDSAVADAVGRLDAAVVFTEPGRLRALRAAGVPATVLGDTSPRRSTTAIRRHPDAAYLVHTSGSTGRPKRVVVPFAALGNAMAGVADYLGIGPDDRVLQFAQPAFDVFFEEVVPSLVTGACLVQPGTVVPSGEDLAALIAYRAVTVVNLPTSYLFAVLEELGECLAGRSHPLRVVVVGGERLPAAGARDIARTLPGAVLVNAYGVTESTITSTMTRFTGDVAEHEVPLGGPLPNVVLVVLGEDGTPLPVGMAGEIAIGGPGSIASYLDEPDRDSYADGLPGHAGRFYRTGDIGVIGLDGNLRFIGRTDRQLKLRGYRVEPEEIETAARPLADHREVAVVPHVVDGVVEGLVGYVETADQSVADRLNSGLRTVLPRYLVVERWVAAPALPRLPNGKVDLAELRTWPLPEPRPAPAGSDETGLLGVVLGGFRSVLKRDVDADADFFASGGHSLLVASLIAWLRRETGVRLLMGDVFEAPTARAVTERLRDDPDLILSTAGERVS